jgi:hypothetical protein
MANEPEYATIPDIQQSAVMTAANTAQDGTGTVTELFVAASKTWVEYIQLKALGTNVASVARLFLNNGSTNATATNNTPLPRCPERALVATTLSNTAEMPGGVVIVPCQFALPTGWKILGVLGTAVAAGWEATVVAYRYS